MKYYSYLCVIAVAAAVFVSCTPAQKSMTPQEFLKIESEILSTDLSPEAKEAVVKKYNYTLKEFEEYAQKVDTDPGLKAKIGEERLKKLQGERQ